MRREHVAVVRQGRRHRLGRTEVYGGIWRKRPWGWRLVARYPLNDDGWRVAEAQFSMWEPDAQPAPVPVPPSQADPSAGQTSGEHTPPAGIPVVRQRRHVGAFGWAAIALSVLILAGAGVLTDHLVAGKSTPSASKTKTTTSANGGSKTSTNGTTKKPKKTYTLPPVGGGWLAHGSSWVVFIQWSSSQGTFSGTAEYDKVKGSLPTLSITTTSIPVSGTLSGDQITLRFNYGAEQFGTITTGRFTVNVPQSTGTLAPVTFVAVSAVLYNEAVDQLQARIRSANAAGQAAQNRAKAETAVYQSATAVLSDIRDLTAEETTLGQQVTGVKAALATEAKGLATERSASASVSSCYTADEVGYTANEVGYSASEVGYAVSTVKREITAIEAEIATLRTAWSTLQAREAAMPTYLPPDQPTPTAVTKAVAAAQAAITAEVSTTNGYIAQANADVKAADTVARQTERAHACSTTTVSPWTPLPTVTG